MFNGRKALLDKIRLREDSYLEVKEVRFAGHRIAAPHRDSLADSVAAFANTRGGVLVLGIEARTHDVLGIPLNRIESVTDFVREVCIDSIDPPIEHLVVEHLRLPASTGEDLPVVKVDVPRSLFVHRSPGSYLHRVANTTRRGCPRSTSVDCFKSAARPASSDSKNRSFRGHAWTISPPTSGNVF